MTPAKGIVRPYVEDGIEYEVVPFNQLEIGAIYLRRSGVDAHRIRIRPNLCPVTSKRHDYVSFEFLDGQRVGQIDCTFKRHYRPGFLQPKPASIPKRSRVVSRLVEEE